jgi:hypothetical protein
MIANDIIIFLKILLNMGGTAGGKRASPLTPHALEAPMFIKIDCQYWQLLGIVIVKQIPLFFAALLQNYLINNFIP